MKRDSSVEQPKIASMPLNSDLELIKRVRKASERSSECIYMLANEPSLACFRVHEHFLKCSSQIACKCSDIRKMRKQLDGALFDIDYSIQSVKKMSGSQENFKKSQEHLKNILFYKQQLDFEHAQRLINKESKS